MSNSQNRHQEGEHLDQHHDHDEQEFHTARKASPMSGCIIFLILIGVFTSLGGFIVWHYLDKQEAIHAISQEEKKDVDVAKYIPSKLQALEAKLEAFSEKVKAKEVATISITAEEINLGIANFDKMGEFKSNMYVTKITKDAIHADVSFPVKSGFFTPNRYINGTMTMEPVIELGSLFPKVIELKPATGSPVPEKLIRFIPQALFSSYRTDPDLEAVFHELSTVTLEEGKMVILSDPDIDPPHIPTVSEGSDNLYTALAICGILFFVLYSTAVMIWWLRKRAKKHKAENLASEHAEANELESEEEEHRKSAEKAQQEELAEKDEDK